MSAEKTKASETELVLTTTGQPANFATSLWIPTPSADPEQSAGHREDDRLDEELGPDVARAGADGHADADLARPLGDRDEHDVHDPDAADEERDAGDRPEEDGHRPRLLLGLLEHLGLRTDHEVVFLAGRPVDPVTLPQERRDLLLRGLDAGRSRRPPVMIIPTEVVPMIFLRTVW